MDQPSPEYLELAVHIRRALALADDLRLGEVGIGLDMALVALAARDKSGTIKPMPVEWDGLSSDDLAGAHPLDPPAAAA